MRKLSVFGFLFLASSLLTAVGAQAGNKTQICHVPQGNENNVRNIHVNDNALVPHLQHGDTVGSCFDACPCSVNDAWSEDAFCTTHVNSPFGTASSLSLNGRFSDPVQGEVYQTEIFIQQGLITPENWGVCGGPGLGIEIGTPLDITEAEMLACRQILTSIGVGDGASVDQDGHLITQTTGAVCPPLG